MIAARSLCTRTWSNRMLQVSHSSNSSPLTGEKFKKNSRAALVILHAITISVILNQGVTLSPVRDSTRLSNTEISANATVLDFSAHPFAGMPTSSVAVPGLKSTPSYHSQFSWFEIEPTDWPGITTAAYFQMPWTLQNDSKDRRDLLYPSPLVEVRCSSGPHVGLCVLC